MSSEFNSNTIYQFIKYGSILCTCVNIQLYLNAHSISCAKDNSTKWIYDHSICSCVHCYVLDMKFPSKAHMLKAWCSVQQCSEVGALGKWFVHECSNLISEPIQWWINNLVALCGGGGKYRRWGLVGGSRLLGACPRSIYLVPNPFLPPLSLCFQATMRWAALLHNALSTMILCLITGPQ